MTVRAGWEHPTGSLSAESVSFGEKLRPPHRNVAALWGAVATAAVAIALRLPLVRFGLPYLLHPDEPVNIAVGARMVDHNTWNPHVFTYPSMLFDVIAIVGRIQRALGGWHLGAGQAVLAMGIGRTSDPHLYVAVRLVTVGFSVGTCIVVWRIVYLVTKRSWSATLAGMLVALSPLMVVNGVYIAPDTYSAFFTAFGLLSSLWILRRGRRRDYVIAGVAVGFAAGAKYDPAVVAVSVVIAHYFRCRVKVSKRTVANTDDSDWKRRPPRWVEMSSPLLLAFVISIVAFVLTTPGAVESPNKFVSGVLFVVRYYGSVGHAGNTGSSLVFYLQVFAHQGFLFVLMVVVGAVGLMGSRRRDAFVVGGFVVCYSALISHQVVHFDRELLPTLVGIAVLGGIGSSSVADLLGPYISGRALASLIGVTALSAVSLVGLGMSAHTSALAYAEVLEHSKSKARSWIYQHIPKGSTVVVEDYGPWLDPTRYILVVPREQFIVDTPESSLPTSAAAIVVTQQGSGRYLVNPGVFKREIAAYKSLTGRYCQGGDFTDGPWVRVFVPCRVGEG